MAAHDQRKGQKQKVRVGPGVDAGKTSRVSKAAGNLGSVYTWPHTHLLLLSFSLIMCCHVRLLLLAVQESRKHLYHSAYVPEKQVQRSTTLPLRAAESLVDDVSS